MALSSFYKELKRRNVFKGALAYIVVSWVMIQVASILFPAFDMDTVWIRYLFIVLLILFPVWLFISWHYEITLEGIKRTSAVPPENSITQKTSNQLNYIIIGALLVAIALLSINMYGTFSNNVEAKDTLVENPDTAEKELDRTVAVLAFADMSPENDQEYFSDGISEEILNYLAKNRELTVISRTSSFSFKNTNTDIKIIGEKLEANYILEGSVRKSGSTLRITAQLIQANNGAHLWSETYDREMDDIFAIQDEIAEEVTKNLEANLLEEKIKKTNTEAYTNYLQAKSLYERYIDQEHLSQALNLVEESIAIDGSYAPVWLLRAKIIWYGNSISTSSLDEIKDGVVDEAMNSISKAIMLDPKFAAAVAYRGLIKLNMGNHDEARLDFQHALQLDPENAEVLRRVSRYPTISHADRLKLLKKALKLDPLEYLIYYNLSYSYFDNKEYEKALDAFNKYLLFNPIRGGEYGYKAELCALLGDHEKALAAVEKETNGYIKDYARLFIALIFKEADRQELVDTFKEKYALEYPYQMAQVYAYQNQKNEAYKWLEKAFNNNDENIRIQIKVDPYMDSLRGDARFKNLIENYDFEGEYKPLELNFD